MSTKIMRHPEATTLISFAAGTRAEPLAAVVAAHAAICRRCRKDLADLDLLGATLVLGQASAQGDKPADLPVRLAKAQAHDIAQRSANPAERLPAPIAIAYELSFESIPWKRLGPGVWHHRLPLSAGMKGDLRLLRIAPGRQMPDHGHGGGELTLVLDGAFSDVTGAYRHGDLQDVDESIEHKPIADQISGCICLIASERPARFKSLFGRLFQPLTGM
jgi:putative transcriptional regulator